MDWAPTATLIFAGVGAAASILNWWVNFSKNKSEKRASKEAQSARWSMRMQLLRVPIEGHWIAELRYDYSDAPKIKVIDIRVLSQSNAALKKKARPYLSTRINHGTMPWKSQMVKIGSPHFNSTETSIPTYGCTLEGSGRWTTGRSA